MLKRFNKSPKRGFFITKNKNTNLLTKDFCVLLLRSVK